MSAPQSLVPVQKYGLSAYKSMLLSLLPTGAIWKNLNATTLLLFEALAAEFNRFEAHYTDLLRESVPGLSTSAELLADWERNVLIPSEYPAAADSDSKREDVVHTKYTNQSRNPTKQFFIDYAAGMGMTITIAQASPVLPFTAGTSVAGDHLDTDAIQLMWVITLVADPGGNILKMLEAFKQRKPAHTAFIYSSVLYL